MWYICTLWRARSAVMYGYAGVLAFCMTFSVYGCYYDPDFAGLLLFGLVTTMFDGFSAMFGISGLW